MSLDGTSLTKSESQNVKKRWLYLSLLVNLGVLFLFKYFNFLSENIHHLFKAVNIFYDKPAYNFLLPVGISFYTFQTLSYTIDVYNGRLKPERDFLKFSLFVSFFPQLVAGPIERATHLIPQFSRKINWDYTRVTEAFRLMLWGFFKKVVIADNLAIFVNVVYGDVQAYSGMALVWATLFFAVQIYCDFSGYSDIAIGSAKILGFDLMTNFKRPYLSISIKEFWARWHISLSTWFRDYVYIPLGGNKVVKWRWKINIFLTFLISGLWHGANWTFVVWGFIHGVCTLLEASIKQRVNFQVPKIIGWLLTFITVVVAWVFFRANSLNDAILIFAGVTKIVGNGIIGVPTISPETFIKLLLMIVTIFASDMILENFKFKKQRWLHYTYTFTILILIYMFGTFEEQEFIYFQF